MGDTGKQRKTTQLISPENQAILPPRSDIKPEHPVPIVPLFFGTRHTDVPGQIRQKIILCEF